MRYHGTRQARADIRQRGFLHTIIMHDTTRCRPPVRISQPHPEPITTSTPNRPARAPTPHTNRGHTRTRTNTHTPTHPRPHTRRRPRTSVSVHVIDTVGVLGPAAMTARAKHAQTYASEASYMLPSCTTRHDAARPSASVSRTQSRSRPRRRAAQPEPRYHTHTQVARVHTQSRTPRHTCSAANQAPESATMSPKQRACPALPPSQRAPSADIRQRGHARVPRSRASE